MNSYLKLRIDDLNPKTPLEYQNALKQVIQEIALLGLERGNFFEKAAFCGGTALRILYDLPHFLKIWILHYLSQTRPLNLILILRRFN